MPDWKTEEIPTGAERIEAEQEYYKAHGYSMKATAFINTLLQTVGDGGGMMALYDDIERPVMEFTYVKNSGITLQGTPNRAYQAIDDAMASTQLNTFIVCRVPFDADLENKTGMNLEVQGFNVSAGVIHPLLEEKQTLAESMFLASWVGTKIKSFTWVELAEFNYDINSANLLTIDYSFSKHPRESPTRSPEPQPLGDFPIPMNRDTKLGLTLIGASIGLIGAVAGYAIKHHNKLK